MVAPLTQETALKNALFPTTDEELMALYQAGDEAAFNLLYHRYSGRVFGYLRLKLESREGVEEVFQATFLKLHHSRNLYQKGLPFPPWLFTITRNTLIDWCRKNKRLEAFNHSIQNESLESWDPSGLQHPDEMPDLTLVPEPQRKALQMRYYEQLSFDEIAQRLSTSPANVRQLISRGIKRLRTTLAARGGNREKA
jgi:RNA polymerase sigma factor (sigma-70 family)